MAPSDRRHPWAAPRAAARSQGTGGLKPTRAHSRAALDFRSVSGVVARWTVLVARFDEKGMIPLIDEAGRRMLVDRANLRDAIATGVQVDSESGYRLTAADVEAGRVL